VATFREPAEDVNSLMFSNVGVENSKSNGANATRSAKVVPHVTHNANVQKDRSKSVSVNCGVGCGVVNKSHICRFLEGVLVVLDGGKERVYSVMCLCP